LRDGVQASFFEIFSHSSTFGKRDDLQHRGLKVVPADGFSPPLISGGAALFLHQFR
jgi:hypothetical protein